MMPQYVFFPEVFEYNNDLDYQQYAYYSPNPCIRKLTSEWDSSITPKRVINVCYGRKNETTDPCSYRSYRGYMYSGICQEKYYGYSE